MFFFDEVTNSVEACSCEVLKGFVTIVSVVYLFVDSTEKQAVRNDKRVHVIIFRQVIIRFFELIYLLRIEDMNLSLRKYTRLSP